MVDISFSLPGKIKVCSCSSDIITNSGFSHCQNLLGLSHKINVHPKKKNGLCKLLYKSTFVDFNSHSQLKLFAKSRHSYSTVWNRETDWLSLISEAKQYQHYFCCTLSWHLLLKLMPETFFKDINIRIDGKKSFNLVDVIFYLENSRLSIIITNKKL